TIIIASITNCAPALTESNQVTFANAFDENGVKASVVYTIEKGSFSQDVIITSPLNPADFDLSPSTTRIQIYSELYSAPDPVVLQRPMRIEQNQTLRTEMALPDLVDSTL